MTPPDPLSAPARRLALRLGVGLRIAWYDGHAVVMLSHGGREVGSYVPKSGFCRVGRVWKRVRSGTAAVRLVGEVMGRNTGRQVA